MLEEIKSLLGEQLQEGVAEKLVELVENHVTERVDEIKEQAEAFGVYLQESAEAYGEHLQEAAENYGGYVKQEVTGMLNEYIEFAVNDFITENTEKFKRLEDYERQSSALSMIKEAFESNGFEADAAKVAISAKSELAEAKAKLAEAEVEATRLNEELATAKMVIIFEEVTRNLADTQKERVKELSEAVTFDGLEDFTKTISLLVEQVVTPAAPAKGEEKVLSENTKPAVTDKMASYLAKL